MSEDKELAIVGEATPAPSLEGAGDEINEKKLLRKLDFRLTSVVAFLYYLSSLDRSNIGDAIAMGLARDISLTGSQYLSTLSIWFVGYILFEIPCNIVLQLTSPRFWFTTLAFTWGIICALMGLTQNISGLLAARFFLGVAQSGLFPGVIFYLSMWYKRNEQHYRIALFLAATTLSGVGGGFFATILAKLGGVAGLAAWRWIFIVEGLFTMVNAVLAYFFLYDYPATAGFLAPKEKEFVIARLNEDNDASRKENFSWDGVIQALQDSNVWLFALCYHTVGFPGNTLNLFLPTITTAFGFTPIEGQMVAFVPYVVAFITTMVVAVFVEKTKRRAPFIIGGSTVALIGYIVIISSPRPGAAYAGILIATAGMFPASSIVVSWLASSISGQTKRATAIALQISVGSISGLIGTQVYRPELAPRYFAGHGTAIGYLIANIVVVSLLWSVLSNENARRDRGERDGRMRHVDRGAFLGDRDPRWRFQT